MSYLGKRSRYKRLAGERLEERTLLAAFLGWENDGGELWFTARADAATPTTIRAETNAYIPAWVDFSVWPTGGGPKLTGKFNPNDISIQESLLGGTFAGVRMVGGDQADLLRAAKVVATWTPLGTGGYHLTLDGGAGRDILNGGEGNDLLLGGDGNDKLVGNGGADKLNGGAHRDKLIGDHLDENPTGGTGTDIWRAAAGSLGVNIVTTDIERIYGSQLGDVIDASGGVAVKMKGLGGNDTLIGSANRDIINGGTGHDTIFGNAGNDTLNGAMGDDVLIGDEGADKLFGKSGNDTVSYVTDTTGVGVNIVLYKVQQFSPGSDAHRDRLQDIENATGTSVGDKLVGDAVDNILTGLDGDDVLDGSVGNDVLVGDAGNDTLFGGSGNDSLSGGYGFDMLYGELGDDCLDGGNDADYLSGGDGYDYLIGGAGSDSLNGGAQEDTLVTEFDPVYFAMVDNQIFAGPEIDVFIVPGTLDPFNPAQEAANQAQVYIDLAWMEVAGLTDWSVGSEIPIFV